MIISRRKNFTLPFTWIWYYVFLNGEYYACLSKNAFSRSPFRQGFESTDGFSIYSVVETKTL